MSVCDKVEEVFYSTEEIVNQKIECPIPIETVPNVMGINLVSFKGMESN